MSTAAAAQMMSVLMYNKRFFPYYVNNILAGLDGEGRGAVYSYDPVGHYSRSDYRATGNSRNLLQVTAQQLESLRVTVVLEPQQGFLCFLSG